MKVILLTDVNKLGKAGTLIDVSDGHARNFLIPKGLAVEATSGKLAEWKNEQARQQAKDDKERRAALELQKELEGKTVLIECRVGENGKLFGSITPAQISEALEAQFGMKGVDKRDIKLDETIKSPGTYRFTLRLHRSVSSQLLLTVSPQ